MSEGYESGTEKPHSLAMPVAAGFAIVVAALLAPESKLSHPHEGGGHKTHAESVEPGGVRHSKNHRLEYNPGVARMQKILAVVADIDIKPDGLLGPDTQDAIERFQRDQDLKVTRTFDDSTVEELETQYSHYIRTLK